MPARIRPGSGLRVAARTLALALPLAAVTPWHFGPSLAAGQENRLRPDPSQPYRLAPGFLGEDAKPGVTNLSGIACRGIASSTRRICVVVDDEAFFVQAASLEDGVLRPIGDRLIRLVWPENPASERQGNRPGPVVEPVGGQDRYAPDRETMERVRCPERDDFKDLDGEGVAFDQGRFYVVGSHGCGRNSLKFRPSGFLLARMRVDDQGQASGLQLSYRLSEVLRDAPVVGDYFGVRLEAQGPGGAHPQGMNIEGVAAVDGRLFFGLRAPALDGDAFVLGVRADDLFTPHDRLPGIGYSLSRVRLGTGAGIRDMAAIPGQDRLLVLSGPAQDQRVPYALWSVPTPPAAQMAERPQPHRLDDARHLGCLGPPAGEGDVKAEVIAVIATGGGDELRVLVLHDGIADGSPLEYRLHPGEGRPAC